MPRLPPEIRVTDRVRVAAGEVQLSYARAGGPGGQHVNKTETKVLLRWNVRTSAALNDEDRALLEQRLAARLTVDGDLLVTSERHRDQSRNVEDAVGKFEQLLREALRRTPPRKKTKPSGASRARRIADKKHRSDVKRRRRDLDG